MGKEIVKNKDDIKRVKTYITGLDEHIQGGIPEGHIVLVAGSAGTMKSSICFNILYHEALKGSNSIYLSLEQSHASLMNHVINMGYDISVIDLVLVQDLSELMSKMASVKGNQKGSIIMVDLGAIRKEIKDMQTDENRSWLNVIKNVIKKVKEHVPIKIMTLDSMSALYVLSKFKNPRIELFYIFEFLRDMEVTSLLISEMPTDGTAYGEYDEDFLSDGIVHVRLTPFRRNIVREISVVKMRTTRVNNDVFSLEFKDGKFQALYGGQNPLL
ncbi:hypothetical protein JW868_00640 [Candidatus Woesearchaeota archaeon]|nr:hypothetical protein [Candidatus Woesearchaeota archaeon]